MTSRVTVQTGDFDVGEVLDAVHAEAGGEAGALASFVGVVRESNDERRVERMTLEHYSGMTERAIEEILDEAATRWDVRAIRVVHRVGDLRARDRIVLVVVASGHRGDAFAACEFVMDYLKTQAPFWKKEATEEGDRWVEARASDAAAAGRWRNS